MQAILRGGFSIAKILIPGVRMSLARLLFPLFLLPSVVFSQAGVRYDSNLTTAAKNVPAGAQAPVMTLPGAKVTICGYPNTGDPCTNQATVYSDAALTQVITQPITADQQGRYGFWAAPELYTYSVSTAGGVPVGTFPLSLNSPPGPQGAGGIGCGTGNCIVAAPSASQIISQPAGTSATVNNLKVGVLHSVFPNNAPGTLGFGDSNLVGIGTTTGGGSGSANVYTPGNSNAFWSIVSQAIGGKGTNCAEGGSQSADGPAQMFGMRSATTGCGAYGPNTNSNPLVIVHFGTNAWFQCAALGGISAGCLANETPAHKTMITWPATTNKAFAINGCTFTGTWTTDTYLPQYAKSSSTVGDTATCSITIPQQASGLAVHWEAFAGTSGSTATIKIDGNMVDTVQSYGFDGQTIQTGFIGTVTTAWTAIYGGLAPGTHSVLITHTGTGPFSLIGISAPNDPTILNAGSPRIVSDGVPQQAADANSAFTASLDSSEKASVALALSVGYPVVFNDFRKQAIVACDLAATNYTLTNPDLTTTTCVASTQPGAHLSDHGHATMASTLLLSIGGAVTAGVPSNLQIPSGPTDTPTANGNGLADQVNLNPPWCVFAGPSGRTFCDGLGYVPAGIVPPQGGTVAQSFEYLTYAPTGNYISFGFYPDSATHPTLQSQITRMLYLSPVGMTSMVPFFSPSLQLGTTQSISSIVTYLPNITPTSVPASSCMDQDFTVTGINLADSLTSLQPPFALGNLSESPGHSAANTLTIHFCNPSLSAATPPAGVYSVMAIR